MGLLLDLPANAARFQLGPAAILAAIFVALLAGAFSPGAAPMQSSTTSQLNGNASATAESGAAMITIPFGTGDNESLNFLPAKIKVVIGVNNTVVWNDLDAAQHTVKSTSVPAGASPFYSGILNQGQTFTVTLTVPGTYRYDCTIHPDWMRGTVQVLP